MRSSKLLVGIIGALLLFSISWGGLYFGVANTCYEYKGTTTLPLSKAIELTIKHQSNGSILILPSTELGKDVSVFYKFTSTSSAGADFGIEGTRNNAAYFLCSTFTVLFTIVGVYFVIAGLYYRSKLKCSRR